MIGEMRDLESFEIAVQAAETGHLVISTMHANSTTTCLERIIEIFPPEKQQQIRVQLAEVFLLIINQRLIPRNSGVGRVLAYEKLSNTPRIRTIIRDAKTHQIRSLLQHSAEEYHPMDVSLLNLVKGGEIAVEEGLKYCEHPAAFKEKMSKRPQ
jgi:twitching motility protein PilT